MKKLIYIILAFVILLSGCSPSTKSQNTESMEDKSTSTTMDAANSTEEVKQGEIGFTGDSKIMPPYQNNINIKSNKPEMSLEDIILKMKTVLEINNSYDEVNSSEYTDENGKKNYNISYTNTKNSDMAWLSADNYGNLQSFNMSYGTENKESSPASREESFEKARNFLVKLYGEQAKEWTSIKKIYANNMESPTYGFSFQRTFEGISIPSDRIDVEVNKRNLAVTSVYISTGTNYDFSDNSYLDSSTDVKDIEEAYKKYKEENKLYKGFLGVQDKESTSMFRKLNYIDVFSQFEGQVSIDAKTLEPKMLLGDTPYIAYSTAEYKTEDASLSNAEKEMLGNIESQKSVEEAENKARELFDLDSSYKLTWSNFGNYMNVKEIYSWDLTFYNEKNYVNVGLLGNDLELISYSISKLTNNNEQNTADFETIRTTAETFLTEKAKMNLSDLEISSNSKYPQNDGSVYAIKYMRALGDDTFIINSNVDILVSADGKEVTNYSKSWDYNFKTRDFKSIINEEEAYEILRSTYGFNLVYKRDLTDESNKPVKLYYEIALPYDMRYPGNTLIVDGNTKNIIDSNGTPVQLASDISYSDLSESKYEKEIKELAENGIGFPDGKLLPKQEIKQIEVMRLYFSLLSYGASPFSISDEEVYNGLKWTNIMGDDQREPNKIVTNEDMAKYSLRSINYQKVAERNHIFVNNYADMKNTEKNFGYLVLAKDIGFIESNSETTLEPNKKIDRETALHYLFNYVNSK